MSMSQTLAPHLPYLRRYARALTGAQPSGDAHVRAALAAILAGDQTLMEGVPPRVALYRIFHAIWQSGAEHYDETGGPQSGKNPEGRLRALSANKRAALLLTAVEAFSLEEAAFIVDESPEDVERAILEAQKTIDNQLASKVLIIEDEPIIALDLENLVSELGHKVVAVAATKDDAVAKAKSERPGRYQSGRRRLRHRCGQRNSVVFRYSGHFHHRISRKAFDRRAPGTYLSDRQALPAGNRAGDGGASAVFSPRRQGSRLMRFHFEALEI